MIIPYVALHFVLPDQISSLPPQATPHPPVVSITPAASVPSLSSKGSLGWRRPSTVERAPEYHPLRPLESTVHARGNKSWGRSVEPERRLHSWRAHGFGALESTHARRHESRGEHLLLHRRWWHTAIAHFRAAGSQAWRRSDMRAQLMRWMDRDVRLGP